MLEAAAVTPITASLPHRTRRVYNDTEQNRTRDRTQGPEQQVPDPVSHRQVSVRYRPKGQGHQQISSKSLGIKANLLRPLGSITT